MPKNPARAGKVGRPKGQPKLSFKIPPKPPRVATPPDSALDIVFDPHSGQKRLSDLVTSGYPIVGGICGRKWGKSIALVNEFLKQWYVHQETTPLGWLVSPTYPMSLVMERKLQQVGAPLILNHYKSERAYILRPSESTNGIPIRVEIKSADDPGALRGPTVGPRLLDEPAECQEEVFDMLLLVSVDSPKSKLLFAGTPKGYGWVHKRLWVPGSVFTRDGLLKAGTNSDIAIYRGPSEENCKEHFEGYLYHEEIERVAAHLPEKLRQQELNAEFVAYEGIVFSAFDPKLDVVDRLPVGLTFTRVVGAIDFGFRHPFASLLMGRDKDNTFWIFDELYGAELPLEHWERELISRRARYSVARYYADPEGAQERDILARHGLVTYDANKAVTPGIQYVQALFEQRRIKIVGPRCPMLVNELMRYQWDKEKDKPVKAFDHAVDCLRYMAWTEFVLFDSFAKKAEKKPTPRLDARGARIYNLSQQDELAKSFQKQYQGGAKSQWPAWYTGPLEEKEN